MLVSLEVNGFKSATVWRSPEQWTGPSVDLSSSPAYKR
jgi:hypothetical protein